MASSSEIDSKQSRVIIHGTTNLTTLLIDFYHKNNEQMANVFVLDIYFNNEYKLEHAIQTRVSLVKRDKNCSNICKESFREDGFIRVARTFQDLQTAGTSDVTKMEIQYSHNIRPRNNIHVRPTRLLLEEFLSCTGEFENSTDNNLIITCKNDAERNEVRTSLHSAKSQMKTPNAILRTNSAGNVMIIRDYTMEVGAPNVYAKSAQLFKAVIPDEQQVCTPAPSQDSNNAVENDDSILANKLRIFLVDNTQQTISYIASAQDTYRIKALLFYEMLRLRLMCSYVKLTYTNGTLIITKTSLTDTY